MTHQCIIGVGSNIEPDSTIEQAAKLLSLEHALLGKSPFQITRPIGFQEQPDFTNGAFLVRTALDQKAFDDYLKSLEKN